ncbi:MAG: hypothetical protein B7Y36_16545 [Novosphingobium sp. 28-62-57]|nr:MAG: hypothetical protein B7Y36_16545 [Novosphingobium sp. 28-62-57]OZA36110.1 MAG: hypothetical protein B7X92_07610 [Novosphingobium sp. 17-62-9]
MNTATDEIVDRPWLWRSCNERVMPLGHPEPWWTATITDNHQNVYNQRLALKKHPGLRGAGGILQFTVVGVQAFAKRP